MYNSNKFNTYLNELEGFEFYYILLSVNFYVCIYNI